MRRWRWGTRGLIGLAVLALLVWLGGWLVHARARYGSSPHRVFVILGFHTSFYHSWRGDTPDEAGFGTDIRIVREILRTLDEANAEGLEARAYWEADNQFTLESILPGHAPDILEGIRGRVSSGRDEVLLAPYNNGFFSAMTEEEVRAALRWARHNPWGSGAGDLFGRFLPVLRPQEGMFTPGLIPLLVEEGIEGLILAYSSFPFTTFSNFVPPLGPAQRFGSTWLRTEPDGPRIRLFPCVSPGDVVDHVSLGKWLLELREMQLDGRADHDLVLHLNFDADAESWLPLDLPGPLRWLPNTGGLREYIEAVNRHEWASFTTPGEFLRSHPPVGEVVVRQDTADGAWDGYYSWAEKLGSQRLWTRLQQARQFEETARRRRGEKAEAGWGAAVTDRASGFWQRMRALSTTHFGMSTPLVNEERMAAGREAVERFRAEALADLEAADAVAPAAETPPVPSALWSFEWPDSPDNAAALSDLPRRLPLLLPSPVPSLAVRDGEGRRVPHRLTRVEVVEGGRVAAELLVFPDSEAGAAGRTLDVVPDLEESEGTTPTTIARAELTNGRIRIALSETEGIVALGRDGEPVSDGPGFLSAFVTYRGPDGPRQHRVERWRIENVGRVGSAGSQARLRGEVCLPGEGSEAACGEVAIELWLGAKAPFVVADVEVAYPWTEKHDLLATPQQKLRRRTDSRWIEVAPFELRPRLAPSSGEFLRVWRRNYLGRVGSFPLDYGRIQPRNAQLDAFNHAVTAAWWGVSDGSRGLLLAQDASVHASSNFAALRLREEAEQPALRINPFGSYHGKQMDYSHLGGSGLGTEMTALIGAAFRPNGPSFNGERQRFRLLLAPYEGDEPPMELQAKAEAFFQPEPARVRQAPAGLEGVRSGPGLADLVEVRRRGAGSGVPGVPRSLLASPAEGAADIVWDPPAGPEPRAYELAWRVVGEEEWTLVPGGIALRHRVTGLVDGREVELRVRARIGEATGPWTPVVKVTPGPVGEQSPLDFAGKVPASLAARVLWQGVVHLLTVK